METQTVRQDHANEMKTDGNNTGSIKKWIGGLNTKKKIIIIISVVVLLFLVIMSLSRNNRVRDCDIMFDPLCELGAPVASTNDFIGKTIKETEELADRLGIYYDIDDYGDIYDPDSEDIQTVEKIGAVYDKENDFVPEYNNYRKIGLSLYKGWRITLRAAKTDKQLEDEKECKAKEGYTYDYKSGKVDCHKTSKVLCEEAGKIYYNWKCYDTQEEVEAEKEQQAKEEADKKAEGENKAIEEEEKKKQESVQPSTSTPNNKPSLNDIADACWSYGQKAGVHLTDYASTEIAQDGNYYRILMWHKDKSVWKCWYNPSDGDVFIEKTKDNR